VSRLEVDESNLVTLRATKLASVERLGAKVDPDNKFKVLTVAADSFGATLGLLVDDWIVKFNGADVIAVSDLKLRANEEYDVEVVVLRPDRAFNVTDVQ
jgi:C-terminal processing protease CtpA/Prc